jgi:hypothetical protein
VAHAGSGSRTADHGIRRDDRNSAALRFRLHRLLLGTDANQVRPESLDAIFRQVDNLRAWLGPKGNVQITDGEVTLRPAGDLVAILRYARQLGLIPMLMTHGDSFRRCPGLLERLMTEGGPTEVSIHVDTTQRGRLGVKQPTGGVALRPLREEFADMIRTARRRTGLPLRAATTLTLQARICLTLRTSSNGVCGIATRLAWSRFSRSRR